jgi:MFS family permease
VADEPALERTVDDDPWRPRGAYVVATFAFVWLVIDLGIAWKTIAGGDAAASQVALFLPSITAAALIAGAGLGLMTVGWLADRFGGVERWRPRVLSGLVGGLVIAVVAVGGMLIAYHSGASVAAVMLTVGVSALIGGAVAAVRPTVTVAAGLAGTLAYAVVSFVEAYFRNDLLNLFGAGDTVATYTSADEKLSLVVSLLTGIIAGATAFIYLRRSGLALPWPVYLGAGAVPGLLLLTSELASWLGGAPLLNAVGRYSAFDRLAVAALQPGRVNHELIVLFVGTITAVILVGRTMKSK